MIEKLLLNRDKITKTTFEKAYNSAIVLKKQFAFSEKLKMVIKHIFNKLNEVTPLKLQKLLYFIQGLSSALNDKLIFEEECEAWVHGPLYPMVYELFKDFKYNPIDDNRFVMFESLGEKLSEEEIKIIDLVIDTFGLYDGKALERITHQEQPWKEARVGYDDGIHSNDIIDPQSIKIYFKKMHNEYDFSTKEGLMKYIHIYLSRLY